MFKISLLGFLVTGGVVIRNEVKAIVIAVGARLMDPSPCGRGGRLRGYGHSLPSQPQT